MDLTANNKRISSSAYPLPYKNARVALCIGGVSAILASICCLGTFLLVKLGFSDGRILYLLTLADWARPFFILLALVTLIFSYHSIWSSTSARTAKGGCITQKEMMTYKCYFLFVVSLVVTVLMLPYFAPNID
jgi:mercuric ion transport protein